MPLHELEPFRYPHNLHNRIKHIPQFPEKPVLAEGMSEPVYIQAVFGDIDPEEIYVKSVQRPAEGIGPHFDIHDDLVNPDYPFVATYNIRGRAILRATVLSDDLQDYYNSRHPVPTEDAKEARRHVGALALIDPQSEVYEGVINPRTGLVIPQVTSASPLVHEIEPIDRPRRPIIRTPGLLPSNGPVGKFMKFIAPRTTNVAINTVVNEGYKSLAERNRIKAENQQRREEEQRKQARHNEVESLVNSKRRHRRGPRYPGGGLLD